MNMKIQSYLDQNNTLRKPSESVDLSKIDSDFLQKLDSLIKLSKEDGIALAAPQVGWHVNLFVTVVNNDLEFAEPRIFVNPTITKEYGSVIKDTEGCMSFTDLYLEIKRKDKIDFEYYTMDGIKHTESHSGLWSRVLQHETDHLKGIVFIDHASRSERIKYQEWAKRRRIDEK